MHGSATLTKTTCSVESWSMYCVNSSSLPNMVQSPLRPRRRFRNPSGNAAAMALKPPSPERQGGSRTNPLTPKVVAPRHKGFWTKRTSLAQECGGLSWGVDQSVCLVSKDSSQSKLLKTAIFLKSSWIFIVKLLDVPSDKKQTVAKHCAYVQTFEGQV